VVEGPFLWAGKSLLDRARLVPGHFFEARLRPAPDDAVETPQDLQNALRSGGVLDAWEALTPGKRRGLIYRIDTAKRPETRAKRITELVSGLDSGE
jgi:uncharacterized protein YdeI (YjbR/CyaY-like superfamily)